MQGLTIVNQEALNKLLSVKTSDHSATSGYDNLFNINKLPYPDFPYSICNWYY